jgi:glycine/D-amino acid oxidase-like deaminating enzyme
VLGASEDARGLFYATGHYRNGILLAPLTAMLLGELIADGRTSNLLDAFTPERFRRAAV